MSNKYIVRADFYPDGSVVPLGLTNEQGKTLYVKRINKISVVGMDEYEFDCIADETNFVLFLKDNKWTCVKRCGEI